MCVTTCDEVCVLCFEIKLLHEENLTERNERKDCYVVGQADETEKPKRRWKSCHVTKLDLKEKTKNGLRPVSKKVGYDTGCRQPSDKP